MTAKAIELEHHVGHFGIGTGAKSIVDEVKEAKKIMEGVHAILVANGVPSNIYQDNKSKTQRDNLNNLVVHHNADNNALIVSYHLNAGGTDKANGIGTEVCHKTQPELATKMSAAIAKAGGFKNRGAKYRNDLAVLNRTIEPAILLETFFVNSKYDVAQYRKNFDAICHAIATVLAEHIGYKLKKKSSKTDPTNNETFYKKGAQLGLYRVIKPCSTYSGVDFTQADKLQSLKIGTAFTVVDIVKFDNKYRFKTKMGEYVSAKRSHLKKI